MGNLDPRASPPAMPPPSMGRVGYVHGLQSSETWRNAANDSRQLVDLMLSEHVWRVAVIASQWIRLKIVYGTARTIEITGIFAPAVLYVPGQCVVYAAPIANGAGAFTDAFAYCSATPVNSAGAPQIRALVSGTQALSDHAVRFVALDNCNVQLGSGGPAVALTQGQSISLIAGSSLVSGDGYLEYEL